MRRSRTHYFEERPRAVQSERAAGRALEPSEPVREQARNRYALIAQVSLAHEVSNSGALDAAGANASMIRIRPCWQRGQRCSERPVRASYRSR